MMFILNFMVSSFLSVVVVLYNSAVHGGADEIHVEKLNYNDDEDGNNEIMQCAICLHEVSEGEKYKILPKCNHAYHVSCIDSWLQINPSCPICRSEVRVKCFSKKCRLKFFVSFFSSLFEGFFKLFLGLSTDSLEDGHYFC
ncbi:hypothetical protein LIER_05814 [Lithospermum erythrorhizon]|uniref:RING-type E3 ubiquitin transferase n=1 Tax=Lithospermum erythrorhizon TaxID=34254 RepID=A0AAV3P258_LITER